MSLPRHDMINRQQVIGALVVLFCAVVLFSPTRCHRPRITDAETIAAPPLSHSRSEPTVTAAEVPVIVALRETAPSARQHGSPRDPSPEERAAEWLRTHPDLDLDHAAEADRPWIALEYAKAIVAKDPQKAWDILHVTESLPLIVPMAYAQTFESWYTAQPKEAVEFLLAQDLGDPKWENVTIFLFRELAPRGYTDALDELATMVPAARRDDMILLSIPRAYRTSTATARELLAQIRDPVVRARGEAWLQKQPSR